MTAEIWQLWWVWCAAALALAIVEILAPGFVFLGFAIGAFAVGLMILVVGPLGMGLPALLFLGAGLSLIAWVVLRRVFALPGGSVQTFDKDIND